MIAFGLGRGMAWGYYAETPFDLLLSGACLFPAIPPDVKVMKRKMARTIFLLFVMFAFFALSPYTARKRALLPAIAAPAAQISFDRDIRPIFAERCLACHGERKQSGGLRLNTKSFAMRGGQSGPVIVVGKRRRADCISASLRKNDDERMPLRDGVIHNPSASVSAAKPKRRALWLGEDVVAVNIVMDAVASNLKSGFLSLDLQSDDGLSFACGLTSRSAPSSTI